jgi:hypothetical protein
MEPASSKISMVPGKVLGRAYISCPASRIMALSSGNVSREWPGMNQVALILYFSKSLSIRRVPIVPANIPREMSEVESSPPYEPSQPATASTSTP